MKKTLYTMNIDNYAPGIRAITYPLLKHFARKCGAEFYEITERKWPDWPIPYETFQIYDLMLERHDDWAIWIDADALVNPETPDWTDYIPTNTCAQNGHDPAPIRWQYDEYFRRDGRHISSCNWHAAVPYDCRDFFRPLDDLTLDQALERISATIPEVKGTCQAPHLISDYTVSRNIARFGLRYMNFVDIEKQIFPAGGTEFYWHGYTIPDAEKIDQMLICLNRWLGGLGRYQKHFMGWDDETSYRMQRRLSVARARAEMKTFYEETKKHLINCREQDLTAQAVEYVKNKVATLAKDGQTITADDIADDIERFVEASICSVDSPSVIP
jgi:hypothetical protein